MTTHTGPAPLETPEQAAERLVPLRGRAHGADRRASEDERTVARMAELKGARDALQAAAKMGETK